MIKFLKIASIFFIFLFVLSLNGQKKYKGLPLIKAHSVLADYRVGNDWTKGNWTISPHIEYDSLFVKCHSAKEDFAFYTDKDSIRFNIKPDEIRKFYVSVNDTAYALTVIKGVKMPYKTLKFDKRSKNPNLKFWYEQNQDNAYLDQLRARYPIDDLIKDAKNDTEKALKILHWVHKQWKHNGNNQPEKRDAISILEEAKEGKNFRCVEYGIVATACLNSVGLKARTLGLKTKDVETTRYGAGHVLLEVYLDDLHKWAILDGQWDVMPFLNDVPLNAVEFQKAISENYKDLEIRTSSDTNKRFYTEWVYPYLYYFDVSFDNREGPDLVKKKIDDKEQLMLVPLGAKNPEIFQIRYKIDYCIYTNSLRDFYAAPE